MAGKYRMNEIPIIKNNNQFIIDKSLIAEQKANTFADISSSK